MKFDLQTSDIAKIAELSKRQALNENWFKFRAGRITASNVGAACKVESISSNPSLIKKICYPQSNSFSTLAIKYGCLHEKDALNEYSKVMLKTHGDFEVEAAPGLQVHSDYPYIAGSPDGLVKCSCCANGIVEVKCPHSIEKGKISELMYLNFKDGKFSCLCHSYQSRSQ